MSVAYRFICMQTKLIFVQRLVFKQKQMATGKWPIDDEFFLRGRISLEREEANASREQRVLSSKLMKTVCGLFLTKLAYGRAIVKLS